jgi:Putative prokaryotic signal transducing protein
LSCNAMYEIFSHRDLTILGYYKSILEAEGIASFIRNEHGQTLGFGFYGMFLRQVFLEPVLCIVADDEIERARSILRQHLSSNSCNQTEWLCTACKESNPASFEVCWKCQAVKNE